MKYLINIICISLLLLSACKNDTSNKSEDKKEDATSDSKATNNNASAENTLSQNPNQKFMPLVTLEMIQNIQTKATQLDITFPGKPMSVSQSNKQSILQSVTFYTKMPAPDPIPCPSIGRIFYAAEGESLYDVEVYFTQGCTYCVFIEGNEPIGACLMSPQGVNFFNQIINQGKEMSNQVKQPKQ